MIKEVTMYTVICDRCGKDVCDGEEFSGWNDKSYVFQIACDEDWLVNHQGNDYCPDCYEYDDDDNLVIKTTKQ